MSNLGLHTHQYYELFDFYHVVEHLGSVASLKWPSNRSLREQWIKKHRKMLLNGEIKSVISAIRTLLPNGPTKALTTELNYFIKNEKRMNYARAKEMAFPLGSGAMESAIRRVINLKLKGAAIFWKKENANAILLLRSFFKAGRWSLLNHMAFTPTLPTF